jgi:hypothetical protein
MPNSWCWQGNKEKNTADESAHAAAIVVQRNAASSPEEVLPAARRSRTRAHRIRTAIIAKLASSATNFRNGCFHRKPGATLVTVDGVWTTDQSRVAKYVLSRDRGRFVRTADAYQKLATSAFTRIQSNIRHDLLRIPYTRIILECTR